ncbi:MAG: stage II sporulation protein M [Siphonobacter sp.]
MREAAFIKQNTDKWKHYEQDDTRNPDELSERFIELTDDLSYARTFYPDSPVTSYLNTLATRFHQRIYANRKENHNRFMQFWGYELPYQFYQSHRNLLCAFLFFLVATILGVVSTLYDEAFVRLILGDQYVNMTIENIKNGDPMAVYKSNGMTMSFLTITINNIRVAFAAFVYGILLSVGTVYVLFYNGVMLGTFFTFLFQQGVIKPALLTVWIHGTLEISAIIIAGCAGLTIGNSILFPKTYSRLESFQRGARQGLKIAIGLMPIFITAGFLEGFVTRQPLYPIVSLFIILLSACFIVWYFIWYPIQLNRNTQRNKDF